MATERPEVCIVGASPAGLAAARAAAREGADVLLLEAREAVGVPPAPASVAFDFLWDDAFRPPPEAVRARHAGVRLRAPGGAWLDVDAPLSVLERGAFDRHLARGAERLGARVRAGVRGLSARSPRHLAADGFEVRPRVTVFADGARSLGHAFARGLRHPGGVTWGAALAFDAPAPADARVTLTFGAHARGGRSQLNPLGGGAWSHWTFFAGGPKDAEALARRALALDARLNGWDESLAKRARFLGVAPDPVYALPGTIHGDGLLLAGGAAGQGGLEMGLRAGEAAGRHAARCALAGETDARSLRAYERAWKREHRLGSHALRGASLLLARLEDAAVDALFAPVAGRRVDLETLRTGLGGSARARAGMLWRATRAGATEALSMAWAMGRG